MRFWAHEAQRRCSCPPWGKKLCKRRDGTGRSRNRDNEMPRNTVAANACDALAPVSAEAERGGSTRDEGEAELAKESGVPLLIGCLEGREPLTEERAEWIRPTGTVFRPNRRQGGGLGCGTHRAEDAGKSSGASLHEVFLGCACLPAGFQRSSQDGLKVHADFLTISARQYANTVRFLGLDGGDFGGADYGGNG